MEKGLGGAAPTCLAVLWCCASVGVRKGAIAEEQGGWEKPERGWQGRARCATAGVIKGRRKKRERYEPPVKAGTHENGRLHGDGRAVATGRLQREGRAYWRALWAACCRLPRTMNSAASSMPEISGCERVMKASTKAAKVAYSM